MLFTGVLAATVASMMTPWRVFADHKRTSTRRSPIPAFDATTHRPAHLFGLAQRSSRRPKQSQPSPVSR